MSRRFSGREPIGETCPEINAYIREARDAVHLANVCDTESVNDVATTLKSIKDSLNTVIRFLDNDMRGANASLREWGKKEAEKVDFLENELYAAKQEISRLESDCDNAQAEADTAQEQLAKLRQEQGFLQDFLRTA